MDDFLEISKRIRIYMDALGKNAPDKGNTERYLNFLRTMHTLSDAVDLLSAPGEDGQLPILTGEKLTELKELYQTASDAADSCLADDTRAAKKAFRNAAVRDIRILLQKDRNVLENLSPLPGTTVKTLFDGSRVRTVDMRGAQLGTEGGLMSVRIPMQYTDENGNVVSGYFTETVSVKSLRELRNDSGEAIKKKYPQFAQQLNAIVNSENIDPGTLESISDALTLGAEPDSDSEQVLEELVGAEAPALIRNREFLGCVRELCEELRTAEDRHRMNAENLKLPAGANLDGRNSAMSAVAGLLGVSGLIARSVPMKLKLGDRTVTGTFMEKAIGRDITKLEENDPLLSVEPEALDTPEAKRQISELQILDYICGNADRHAANVLYRFEDGRLAGIMGTDNDASFARAVPQAGRGLAANMTPLKYCKAVSESLADRILHTSKDMLAVSLAATGLTAEEIDFAWQRMQQVQKQLLASMAYFSDKDPSVVESGKTRIVRDGDWDKVSLWSLASSTLGEEREKAGRPNRSFTSKSGAASIFELKQFAQTAYEEKHNPAGCVPEPLPTGTSEGFEEDLKTLEKTFAGEAVLHRRQIELLCDLVEANDPGYLISSDEFSEMKNALYDLAGFDFDEKELLRKRRLLEAKEAYVKAARMTFDYAQMKLQEEKQREMERRRRALAKTVHDAMRNQVKALDKILGTDTKLPVTRRDRIQEEMDRLEIDENEFISSAKLEKSGALMYLGRDGEVHIACTNKKGQVAEFAMRGNYTGFSRLSQIKNPYAKDPADSTVEGALIVLRAKLNETDPYYVSNSKKFTEMMKAVRKLCVAHTAENLMSRPDYADKLKTAYTSALTLTERYISEKGDRYVTESRREKEPDKRGEQRLELALKLRTLLTKAVKIAEHEGLQREQKQPKPEGQGLNL